jgi:hypothetical protein
MRRPRPPFWALAAVGYTALAVLLFARLWAHPSSRLPAANIHDAEQYTWVLGWMEHAVSHGLDPFISHAMNAPAGVNMGWNALIPLPALLLSPVTALAGPVFATVVLLTLCPAAAALAGCLVLRRLDVGDGRSFVGGLLYGFSPAVVSAALGHAHVGLAVLPPVILLLALRLWQGAAPRRTGGLLGLACAGQLLIGEEVLVDTIIVGLLLLVVLAWGRRDLVRQRWRGVLAGSGVAAGTLLVVCAWPLAEQLFGPQRLNGQIYDERLYAADVHGLLTSTPLQALHGSRDAAHLSRFAHNLTEPTGYLGLSLLVLVVVGGALLVRDRSVRVSVLMAGFCFALSLGDVVHVGGHETPVHGPWSLVSGYPGLENVLPARFALFTMLFLGAAVAFGLRAANGRGGSWRWGSGICVALALIPLVPALVRPATVSTPRFFSDGAAARFAAGGGLLVLPYPSPDRTEPMVWQSEAGFPFSMPGGYFLGPDPTTGKAYTGGYQRLSSAVFTDVAEKGVVAPLDSQHRNQLADDLAAWRTRAVVLGPAPHHDQLRDLVTAALRRSPERVDGVEVWPSVRPDEVR